MSATIERLRVGRPVTWRTLVGLLLVPIVAAGVLLWGLWSVIRGLVAVPPVLMRQLVQAPL